MPMPMSEWSLPPNPWFAATRVLQRPAMRLFCLPYAGGSAAVFRDWPDFLPRAVAVCPIQLPGRLTRIYEPPLTDLRTLVRTLAQTLRPYLDLPFACFGHSMGALVAFELARELRRLGAPLPQQLFVSGRRAPHLRDTDPPLFHLPDDELLSELRKLNGTPQDVLDNAELMRLLLPVLRADFQMCQTYVYDADAPLSCPIAAFGGASDPELDDGQLDAWREHTHGAFTRHVLPGDHFYLHAAQPLLLRLLSQDLARAIGVAAAARRYAAISPHAAR